MALITLLLSLQVGRALAAASNRTIDDELGDSVTGALPTYSPQNVWTQGSTCASCFSKPSVQQAVDHSVYFIQFA